MLQITTDVRTVHTQRVVAIRAADMMNLCQRLPEVAAYKILIPQFGTKCGSVSHAVWIWAVPVEMRIEADSVDVGAVVVVLHHFWSASVALVTVTVLVPIDISVQMQPSPFALSLLYRKEQK